MNSRDNCLLSSASDDVLLDVAEVGGDVVEETRGASHLNGNSNVKEQGLTEPYLVRQSLLAGVVEGLAAVRVDSIGLRG